MTPLAWLRGLWTRVVAAFWEGVDEADRRLASRCEEEE